MIISPRDDMYFTIEYARLYEKHEHARAECFEYKCDDGIVKSTFLVRDIDGKCCDIITPYGYGGPVVIEQSGDKQRLIKGFETAFFEYANDMKIVSEFIRFHPLVGNVEDFLSVYDVRRLRKTVCAVITDDPVMTEMSRSARKKVNRAIKEGVEFDIIKNPTDLNDFVSVYESTMDRNTASEYYYFDNDYFRACVNSFDTILVRVKADNKIIAAGLYFPCGDVVHCHLSGTDSNYLSLSPACVIKYATLLWAKENGKKYVFYGGGRSNDENDSLYLFKKSFGSLELDFSVGRKVWNETEYNRLCRLNGKNDEGDFFPAYRR